jgi:hypothetical protein
MKGTKREGPVQVNMWDSTKRRTDATLRARVVLHSPFESQQHEQESQEGRSFAYRMDPLPVPSQLETQLGKCKTVRSSDFYKSREKTPAVRGAGAAIGTTVATDSCCPSDPPHINVCFSVYCFDRKSRRQKLSCRRYLQAPNNPIVPSKPLNSRTVASTQLESVCLRAFYCFVFAEPTAPRPTAASWG